MHFCLKKSVQTLGENRNIVACFSHPTCTIKISVNTQLSSFLIFVFLVCRSVGKNVYRVPFHISRMCRSGSASGSVSQRHRSEDPDPHLNIYQRTVYFSYLFRFSSVARLQFRLPDGRSQTHQFPADTPLSKKFLLSWKLEVLPILSFHFYFSFLFENFYLNFCLSVSFAICVVSQPFFLLFGKVSPYFRHFLNF
jgi:hypothetical protein